MIPVNLPSGVLLPHAISKRWSLVGISCARVVVHMSQFLVSQNQVALYIVHR